MRSSGPRRRRCLDVTLGWNRRIIPNHFRAGIVSHPIRRAFLIFLLPSLALASACRPSQRPRATASAAETWDAFVDRFLEAHFAANPGFAVFEGRHEYDGKLPDWSEAGIRREVARLRTAHDSAAAWDTTGLD